MKKFSRRSDAPEIMDDLNFDDPVIFQTLKEIDIINRYLGGNRITLDALNKVLRQVNSYQAITIGDLGCGSGDSLRQISGFLQHRNHTAKLIGLDANPHIIRYAKENTPDSMLIEYKTVNILAAEFSKSRFDIATATLFFHHFTDQQLVSILKTLRQQVRVAIIINDLHRHWLAYYSIKWLTGVFSRSYMVQYDACLSVLRAFNKKELERIIKAAGFTSYSIEWKWAFRFQIILWC